MNHPTQEQWMEYLYGELQSPERKSLDLHMKSCPVCREKNDELLGTMRTLDQWQVGVHAKHSLAGMSRFHPAVKWAAAAALLVTTAFATGRLTKSAVDVEALQAQISAPLEQRIAHQIEQEMQAASEKAMAMAREKVELELAARIQEISRQAQAEALLAARDQMQLLAASLGSLREEDRKTMNAALKTFETQWLTEYRKMREDLERVALFSDQSYRKAQRQLVQLASYNQPENDPVENEN